MLFVIVLIRFSSVVESSHFLRLHSYQDMKFFADAINDVLSNIFPKLVTTANLISSKNPKYAVCDIKDEMFKNYSVSSSVISQQESINHLDRKRHFSIFLIENVEEFLQIYEEISSKYFQLDGYYIIAL